MKKIILAAFMAACGLQMSAQQNLFVAQDLESAIVNKDNTVTFNFITLFHFSYTYLSRYIPNNKNYFPGIHIRAFQPFHPPK